LKQFFIKRERKMGRTATKPMSHILKQSGTTFIREQRNKNRMMRKEESPVQDRERRKNGGPGKHFLALATRGVHEKCSPSKKGGERSQGMLVNTCVISGGGKLGDHGFMVKPNGLLTARKKGGNIPPGPFMAGPCRT